MDAIRGVGKYLYVMRCPVEVTGTQYVESYLAVEELLSPEKATVLIEL